VRTASTWRTIGRRALPAGMLSVLAISTVMIITEIGAAPNWSGYARKLTWRVSTAFEFCSLQRWVEQICRAHQSVAMIGEVCAASRRGVFSSNTERTHTRDTRKRGSRNCSYNPDIRNCNRGRSSRSSRGMQ